MSLICKWHRLRHITGERLMFYRKNIYSWEQGLRIMVSGALVAYAALAMPASTLSYILIAGGIGFGLTGVFGFCPMCAMVGRRLKTANEGK
jgi:Protein of unknown function (DUF2892)